MRSGEMVQGLRHIVCKASLGQAWRSPSPAKCSPEECILGPFTELRLSLAKNCIEEPQDFCALYHYE